MAVVKEIVWTRSSTKYMATRTGKISNLHLFTVYFDERNTDTNNDLGAKLGRWRLKVMLPIALIVRRFKTPEETMVAADEALLYLWSKITEVDDG